MSLFVTLVISVAFASPGVREVSRTSCQVIRVNLGLGMTTEIVLERDPKETLYADKKHFKVSTSPVSPRSLAVIPFVDSTELNVFRNSRGRLPPADELAQDLDKSFKTNLFVFFENGNQLMFELRFVEKKKADYILKVNQAFEEDCVL